MTTKAVGYSVSVTTAKKRSDYRAGYLTKEQALKLAMKLATTSNKIEIDREYEKTDRYGDTEAHSRPFGVVKKVKRKSGYAFVIQTFDAYGWDSWTYDLMPDGKMKNRR